MGNCLNCGHEYERHVFGGMCFYCDCKKAAIDIDKPVFLRPHNPKESARNKNGTGAEEKSGVPRLGNK